MIWNDPLPVPVRERRTLIEEGRVAAPGGSPATVMASGTVEPTAFEIENSTSGLSCPATTLTAGGLTEMSAAAGAAIAARDSIKAR